MDDRTDSVDVALRGPLDVPGSLAPLGRWGDDGIDRWDGVRLLRMLHLPDGPVPFRVRPTGTIGAPAAEVTAPAGQLDAVVAALRTMFVDGGAAFGALVAADPRIAALDVAFSGRRPVLTRDPFTALIRAISAQQVNLRWAAQIRWRLAEAFGRPQVIAGETLHVLDAAALAAASVEDLGRLQLTKAKSRSVIAVARAAIDGALDVAILDAAEDHVVAERLLVLPGIGPWTVDWFLARTLGRPRVVAGDLGVRKAVGRTYLDGRMPSEAEVRDVTAHWGAAAGVAQQLLLEDLAAGG